jgi:NAD(P)-dependent dehydrogenase (short-subunit alcohol dehydrogenase family)
MGVVAWLNDQKLSDWVQGIGTLAAAGAAVWIALRQDRLERHRAEAARQLRAQILAAAMLPVLLDIRSALGVRRTLLQSIRRLPKDEAPPHPEELTVLLPDIFMNTIDKIDVLGAAIAAQIYTFVHRMNDYNKQVHNYRDWEVPPQIWEANLRPKLEGIQEALDFLVPHLTALLPETAATR